MNILLARTIVSLMNDLFALDREAVNDLVGHRVMCNEALANHPTVQVQTQDGYHEIGLLGILNGLCGVYEEGPKAQWGCISAEFDDQTGRLIGFGILENE